MASAHFTLHSISCKYLRHQARPIILMTLYMEEGNLPNCQRLMILQREHFNELVYYISTYVNSSVERALC